jgi:hypothetical protein
MVTSKFGRFGRIDANRVANIMQAGKTHGSMQAQSIQHGLPFPSNSYDWAYSRSVKKWGKSQLSQKRARTQPPAIMFTLVKVQTADGANLHQPYDATTSHTEGVTGNYSEA